MAGYIYSQDGMAFRRSREPQAVPEGSAYFARKPSIEDISEAFPNYTATLSEKNAASRGKKIDTERDRRFALGAPINLGGGLAFRVDVVGESRTNVTALAYAAGLALAAGAPFETIFRDAANQSHPLDAAQTTAMAQQALAYVSAVYGASWALKDAVTPPTDEEIVDPAKWPAG